MGSLLQCELEANLPVLQLFDKDVAPSRQVRHSNGLVSQLFLSQPRLNVPSVPAAYYPLGHGQSGKTPTLLVYQLLPPP